MISKLLLSSALSFSLLSAVSVDELVKSSFENNYDLRSLEKSILVAQEQINVSKNWENPMLSFKTNNIKFNKPLSNQKEYGVELSQVIPLGNRLELESKVYQYAYSIVILEKRYKLLENYLKNLDKSKELYSSLYKVEKASLNDVLNANVSYLDLKLELENLKNMIDNMYLSLEDITYRKIDSVEEKIEIKELTRNQIDENLSTHPKIKALEENSLKYQNMAHLEDSKRLSSVTLSVEYMQNSEQDYANVTIGIPLPIYKTESTNSLKAKLSANENSDKLDNVTHSISIQIDTYLNNLNRSAKNYNLIQKELIPLKKKIQKNMENYNSFDS